MSKFLFAGVAAKNDVYKVRFATDEKRIAALSKDGQVDIRLVPLPEAMDKLDAARFISTLDLFQDAEAQYCILEYIKTEEVKASKGTKQKGPAVVQDVVVEADEPVVDSAELDDLPY